MEKVLEERMRVWRQANPKATLREIEDEVERQLAVVRVALISATIAESAAGGEEEGERCPECGGKLKKWGRRKRKLQAPGGETLEVERAYLRCAQCGYGVFPPGLRA